MIKYYKLVGKETFECSQIEACTRINDPDLKHCIAMTKLYGGIVVSTVFLFFDHEMFRRGNTHGQPELFETIIFDGSKAKYKRRYATYEEAEKGHAECISIA